MSLLRHLLSRLVGALLLLAVSPILLIIAGAVRLLQGPGVLFQQDRAGYNGTAFRLVKFRTMRDTRDSNGALLPDEMRTTAIGSFLRKSRLDELPSFWNVARGDLAFIGPRPLLPHTIAALGDVGKRRGAVRPGLTGWSQVNGNTLLSLEEKVALDLWYIDHRRWNTDLIIILATIWVMVAGEKLKLLGMDPSKPS